MTEILKSASALPLIMFVSLCGFSSAASAQPATATAPAPLPATAADVKAGAQVRDSKGVPLAKALETQGTNVVLDTGQAKIAIPMTFLVKDSQGLMLNITADQFNAAVAKAHARAEAAKAQQPSTPQPDQPQTTPPKH